MNSKIVAILNELGLLDDVQHMELIQRQHSKSHFGETLAAALKEAEAKKSKIVSIVDDLNALGYFDARGCILRPDEPETVGKRQNKSENLDNAGYAETISQLLGKRQNKSEKSAEQTYAEMTAQQANEQKVQAVIDLLHYQAGLKRCKDKTIIAVLRTTQDVYFGTNGVKHQPDNCPRNQANDKINQGYEKCTDVCQQPAHAEINAIQQAYKAGDVVIGATINVYGTQHICQSCLYMLNLLGIGVGGVSPDFVQLLQEIESNG